MKHKKIMGVFLALLIICIFISGSDNSVVALKGENSEYMGEHINATISLSTAKADDQRDEDADIFAKGVKLEDIPLLDKDISENMDVEESPKPSDTTVTEKPKPTDTTESGGPDKMDMTESVRPKTSVISSVKIPKTGDDLELIACVLMLLISCLVVTCLTIYGHEKDSRKYRS
jgi:hypothetical protein